MSVLSAVAASPVAELDMDTQKLAIEKKREQDLSRKWARGVRDGNRHGPLESGVFGDLAQHQWDVPARNHGARDAMKAEMKIRPVFP